MRYELFYLIGASREADADKIKEEVKKMVEETGGVFEEKETVEKRRLAYKIKHETHGIYVAQRFELDSEKIGEVNNKMNLYTGTLRFIISRADELPELKSKEERINEANSKSQEVEKKTSAPEKKVKKKEEKAEAAPEEKEEKKEEAAVVEEKEEKEKEKEKEEPAEKDDDIDKKLEEILNI